MIPVVESEPLLETTVGSVSTSVAVPAKTAAAPDQRRVWLAHVAYASTQILYAGFYVVTRVTVSGADALPPPLFAGLRLALATVALAPVALWVDRRRLPNTRVQHGVMV